MCGICGFSGEPSKEVLAKMVAALVHRGPDEAGYYLGSKISLGMRRLSILDLQYGKQPVENETGEIRVVFNGEIYNFQHLREDLEAKGHRFKTHHSDTEILVHLYEDEGLRFPQRLNGMFAIALWDSRTDELLLVRDRMGVKPLFYSVRDGNLIFGSEIKALLEHPAINREIDCEGLYHYFFLKCIPAPFTAFKGIHSLLPGEIIRFSRGVLTKEKWWKIHFEEDSRIPAEVFQQRILSCLEDATRIRMVADVPVGAYLSGGLDSSTIVALMARFSTCPIKTFSLGYEDELKNKDADLFHARALSRALGTEHHEYIMSAKELLDDLPLVIGAFDQPFSGTISTFFLSKLIRKHVKVALSGDGADELFGSYLSHRLSQPMAFLAKQGIKEPLQLSGSSMTGLSKSDLGVLEKLFRISNGDEATWRYHLGVFTDPELTKMLSQDFLRQVKPGQAGHFFRTHFSSLSSKDSLNRILEMEWNTQLPDQILAFIDFLSMAHSVEVRSPFLDFRLAELAATIPGKLKIQGGIVKKILKQAVSAVLPPEIINRPKEGFVLPIFDWMAGKLHGFFESMLSPSRIRRSGILNPACVTSLWRKFSGGKRELAAKVWNIVVFQEWIERYFP